MDDGGLKWLSIDIMVQHGEKLRMYIEKQLQKAILELLQVTLQTLRKIGEDTQLSTTESQMVPG